MYLTTNGGDTWEASAVFERGFIRSFDFLDKDTGLAIAVDGIHGTSTIRTTDGGASWSVIDTIAVSFHGGGHMKQAYSIKCFDRNTYCVMGTPGFIKWTRDGGNSWTETTNPYCTWQADFDFVNDSTILIVGQNSPVVRASSRATKWEPLQGVGTPLSIVVIDGNVSYSVGTGGFIVKSTDAGATWLNNAYPVGITSDYDCSEKTKRCRLVKVRARDTSDVWIVGDSGGLFTLDQCSVSQPSDSILGYRATETHQVVTYALRNDPDVSYQWIATGGYLLGETTNHYCDVIWGYGSTGSVCCIVSDSSCTDTICVDIEVNNKTTGIAGDGSQTPQMSVQPNPTSDMIDIASIDADDATSYTLLSVTGEVMKQAHGVRVRMNVEDVPSGVYHVIMRNAQGVVVAMQRVVVQK